ncbi:gas vesicle structural protein GvpA [Streptomyces filamentosus]|uniref:gas vesicle structural protein GvpA n=1 Tax=Streptomyces filamentosus TaxID=67294 RepID=UPI0033FBF3B7
MSVVQQGGATPGQSGTTGTLYDVLDLILDRGLVIDAFIRVSLVGIEIAKIDVRVVVASVDTYLRFAEACNRLDLESGKKAPAQLTDVMEKTTEGGAKGKTKGALTGAVEAFTDSLTGRDDEREEERASRKESEDESEEREGRSRRGRGTRRSSARRSSEEDEE